MKKLMIAVACIAVAFATMSCSKKTNDPDSINLKDYNPQDAPSCWAVTTTTLLLPLTHGLMSTLSLSVAKQLWSFQVPRVFTIHGRK